MAHQLSFSEEEYRSLLVLLGIGQAIASGEEGSEPLEDLVKYVYSQAGHFNCEDLIAKKMGNSLPTEKLDEQVVYYLDLFRQL